MKYYNLDTVFQFPWEQLAVAFWKRYPNPHSGHVLTEDIIHREVVGNRLFSKRLLTKTEACPKWAEAFMRRVHQVCILEESIIDLDTHTITTYTRNIGLQKYMTLEEKCVYSPSKESSQSSVCERQAWITSKVFGFASAIEQYSYKRFKKHSANAVKGFVYVLKKLYTPEALVSDHNLLSTEKFKETARKAKELAKSKAEMATTQGNRPIVKYCVVAAVSVCVVFIIGKMGS
ncbi:hypothetical protein ACJMK2_006610 [Sinanodonta woodiana]|uniref:PRELI/MSF1 domain-containing protein n=1 Tax=Sinanodonta woodiana TaxID=1069815 RepID=A0ABD3VTP6_SINWO